MNETFLLSTYFVPYIIECANNKITQKLSMIIKFINGNQIKFNTQNESVKKNTQTADPT